MTNASCVCCRNKENIRMELGEKQWQSRNKFHFPLLTKTSRFTTPSPSQSINASPRLTPSETKSTTAVYGAVGYSEFIKAQRWQNSGKVFAHWVPQPTILLLHFIKAYIYLKIAVYDIYLLSYYHGLLFISL